MNTKILSEVKQQRAAVQRVFEMLRDREINPCGEFDNAGRFYAEHSDLISVRSPSRRWPYSHMVACRTKKYVLAVAKEFDCQTVSELLNHV